MRNGLLDRVARIEAQLSEMTKTFQAVARVVGTEEVVAELATGARGEMAEIVDRAVKEGKLEKGAVVGEVSLLVGHEQLKDGKVVHPGRFQVFVRELSEDNRKLFLGKKAGEEVLLPNGNKVTLSEVYDPVVEAKPKKTRKPRSGKLPTTPGGVAGTN